MLGDPPPTGRVGRCREYGWYPASRVGGGRIDRFGRRPMSEQQEFRIEHDSMGEVRVPSWAKWRAQTQRAVENFPISGQRLDRAHIAALGHIKAAAAKVNADLGVLEVDMAAAIADAAYEVADGRWDGHFP